jgi:hypothetical protein
MRLNLAGVAVVGSAMTNEAVVGARATLRAAQEWNGGSARAISLLRRPDVVKSEFNRRGTFLASRIGLGEPLRRPPEGASATLPPSMLLLLDFSDALHLFAANQKLHLHLGEEVMSWGAGAAEVTVLPGHGNFRPVEIDYGSERLLVAAPWRGSGTQAALELIARVTGRVGA